MGEIADQLEEMFFDSMMDDLEEVSEKFLPKRRFTWVDIKGRFQDLWKVEERYLRNIHRFAKNQKVSPTKIEEIEYVMEQRGVKPHYEY